MDIDLLSNIFYAMIRCGTPLLVALGELICEKSGLIAAQRSANGYREYPSDMVQLVLYIRSRNAWASASARSAAALPRCGRPAIQIAR